MINLEINEGVAILTIARPERRNALSGETIARLDALLRDMEADERIRAVVLAGSPPSFCAGSDLKDLGTMDVNGMVAHEMETARVARKIGQLNIPVVAAVEGHALGGGFILAMSCDLVVSAENAKWSLPEVPNGWIPPWGLKALTARVGASVARRLTWGYEVLDGAEAVRLGVADYCVPADTARAEAIAIAKRLAALPHTAVASTKLFFQSEILKDAELWDERAGRLFAADCAHPDAKKTLSKFGAKK